MTYLKGKNGVVLNVKDSVGEGLIAAGHAKRATEAEFKRQAGKRNAPAPPTEPEQPEDPQEPEGDGSDTHTPDTPGDDQGAPSGAPAGNASTDDWHAYALDQGFSEEQLEGLKRDEIRTLVAGD